MKISASFLSIKDNLKENIKLLSKSNIDYLHLDIMDGIFVPNKTWNIREIKELVKDININLDVHLMVKDIYSYIDEYKVLNPEYITIHYEVMDEKAINYIRNNNIKVGISIKPDTDVKVLDKLLPYIDLVLIMSVEPGFGGQKFLNSSIEKVNYLKNIRKEKNYNFLIEIDGGINDETIKLIDSDIYVVGSFITNGDYQKQVNILKNTSN